jgi:hypothetical protein
MSVDAAERPYPSKRSVRTGHPLAAKRVLISGLGQGLPLIGASGSSDIVTIASVDHRNSVYTANLANGARRFTRRFSLQTVLPLAFRARGTEFFYLTGHGPMALWLARITSRSAGPLGERPPKQTWQVRVQPPPHASRLPDSCMRTIRHNLTTESVLSSPW